nr:MAG TPA: heavy metal sensor kinase [Caudoviricetes sp.]
MKKLSLKLKITLWYTFIMIIVSTVVLLAMTSISTKMLNRETVSRLTRSVNDMSRELERNPDIHRVPDFKYFDQGVQLTLYDDDGNLAGGQLPFGITEKLSLSDGETRRESYNGNSYYVSDKKFISASDKRTYWIKGIVSISDGTYAINSLAKYNALLAAVMIVIAALGGYIIIQRTLIPVNKIRTTADEISESNDLSRRIGLNNGNDEFCRLAQSFDKMLDRIEQTVEREKQFTSDASHELRTPVTAVLSACEYMINYAKDYDELKSSAVSVKEQAERMSRLISGLLTISRMDKNTIQTTFEEVDVSELLEFVCDEQEEIHTENIKLLRQIDEGICARADRLLLIRLCINLISNAYSYGKDGGTVNVSLKSDLNTLTLSVSDDGIGIPPEHLPKIWERFYRVDPSRSENTNGSMGLGLSMVKWIAECHGGSVSVTSVTNAGSTFTFTMPIIKNPV